MDVEKIKSMIAPVVKSYGVEINSLSFRYLRSGALLRVFVDRRISEPVPVPYPGSPVDLGLLEGLSREISATIAACVPGGAAWSLEISSPGLDRPISPDELRFFIQHPVRVAMRAPVAGRRNFSGKLVGVDEADGAVSAITLEVDQVVERLEVAGIESARLNPVFPQPQPKNKKKKG